MSEILPLPLSVVVCFVLWILLGHVSRYESSIHECVSESESMRVSLSKRARPFYTPRSRVCMRGEQRAGGAIRTGSQSNSLCAGAVCYKSNSSSSTNSLVLGAISTPSVKPCRSVLNTHWVKSPLLRSHTPGAAPSHLCAPTVLKPQSGLFWHKN